MRLLTAGADDLQRMPAKGQALGGSPGSHQLAHGIDGTLPAVGGEGGWDRRPFHPGQPVRRRPRDLCDTWTDENSFFRRLLNILNILKTRPDTVALRSFEGFEDFEGWIGKPSTHAARPVHGERD